MYVFGCKLSVFRLCDSDFGITAVDGITIGITCAVFCFHRALISFASSRHFSSFSFTQIIIIIIIIIYSCVRRSTYLILFYQCTLKRRSQWPRGLRRRSTAARLLRSQVRIPRRAWMFVCCESCVVSYRSLRRIDHSSRGVLLTVARTVWSRIIEKRGG
jgi:hypothetical protein